jgi:hypothetical protein
VRFVQEDPSLPRSSPLAAIPAQAGPLGLRDVTFAAAPEAGGLRLGRYDAGFAGLELTGAEAAAVLRRLTDLDLDALPAIGAVARVRTLVAATAGGYRLFVAREHAEYLADCVVDAAEGLA